MKKIIPLIPFIFVIVCMSFVDAGRFNAYPDSWSKADGLKGNVKMVIYTSYEASVSNGNLVKGAQNNVSSSDCIGWNFSPGIKVTPTNYYYWACSAYGHKIVEYYSLAGRKVRTCGINAAGDTSQYITYAYDAKGALLEMISYAGTTNKNEKRGTPRWKAVFTYDSVHVYRDVLDATFGAGSYVKIIKERSESEYVSNSSTNNGQWILNQTTKFEYDEYGCLKSTALYKPGKSIEEWKQGFGYSSLGDLTDYYIYRDGEVSLHLKYVYNDGPRPTMCQYIDSQGYSEANEDIEYDGHLNCKKFGETTYAYTYDTNNNWTRKEIRGAKYNSIQFREFVYY